ncbi:hypothetical protein SDC9_173236 [bioreactor metagenome]|uniref:Copper amine oxidase-like N-terminal domain-containing protein n=1 Tax=bioreactor metagenome TaxID=1076179 RepID=A0A645GI27_9ZZZZ
MQAEAFCSPDGITRYPCTGGLLNSRKLIRTDIYKGIIHVYDINALKALGTQPPAVKVQLNGEYLSFAVSPVIESDRTLIPLRFLFERAGATVDWSGSGAVIRYGDREITVNINEPYTAVNGIPKKLDVPARLIEGKMMVPLRFIAEECGFSVDYDETSQTVSISTADNLK